MSETVHYKGTLRPLTSQGGNLEEAAKAIWHPNNLPDYYDTYLEAIEESNVYFIFDGIIYSVDAESPESTDVFNAQDNGDATFSFEVVYYNGGCSFTEALETAIKNIKPDCK